MHLENSEESSKSRIDEADICFAQPTHQCHSFGCQECQQRAFQHGHFIGRIVWYQIAMGCSIGQFGETRVLLSSLRPPPSFSWVFSYFNRCVLLSAAWDPKNTLYVPHERPKSLFSKFRRSSDLFCPFRPSTSGSHLLSRLTSFYPSILYDCTLSRQKFRLLRTVRFIF